MSDIYRQLRTQKPFERYLLDISSIKWDKLVTVTGILENLQGGTNLTLNISQSTDHIFRLQIAEIDSTRHQLKNVLVEVPTPKTAFTKVDILGNQIIITTPDNVTIKIQKPFQISITQNETTSLVFDGQRLNMKQVIVIFLSLFIYLQ